jgi:hypothetical protein
MKKLFLILTFLLTSVVFAEETDSDIEKYNFYWNQVPVVCAAPEEIDRWARDKGFMPLSISYGRANGQPDGEIVYIVTYYLQQQTAETFATVSTPTDPDVCIVFRTFNLLLNPNIMKEKGLTL